MKRIVGVHPNWGITVVRLMTGLLFAVHGYQKFAGGLGGVAAFFAKVAIPFPGLMAPFITILELVGGILLFLGVATRVVACLFAVEMLVTTLWVKTPGQGWKTRATWTGCCSSPASSSSLLAPGLPRSTASGGKVTKRATDEVRRRDAGVAPAAGSGD